jgi:hypothetical protein
MLNRLQSVLKLDAVVPLVLIVAALLMTLEPTILGVTISERQILLAFFGFLGIDTLIERTGRLRRIERQLELLTEKASGPQAGQVLRARSSFERMDVLVAQARRSVLIIGVNLEGALVCTAALTSLARSGGTVRLLAMDPDGAALLPSSAMSEVDPALRRGKIVQNLELLRKELAQLAPDARGRVQLMVADLALPVGAVGLDEDTRAGSLVVQHYLTGIQPNWPRCFSCVRSPTSRGTAAISPSARRAWPLPGSGKGSAASPDVPYARLPAAHPRIL